MTNIPKELIRLLSLKNQKLLQNNSDSLTDDNMRDIIALLKKSQEKETELFQKAITADTGFPGIIEFEAGKVLINSVKKEEMSENNHPENILLEL